MTTLEADQRRGLIRRVISAYLAPHWPGFVTAMVCAAIAGGLTAALAWLLDPAVKKILVEHDRNALFVFPAIIIGV
ncbi:MAG: hypothetical protein ACXW3D_04095, partial [Caulobacteraceae bacterium]